MTLRHIVSWKLSGETREQRDAQAREIAEVLLPLGETVPSIRAIAVHRNELFDGENYDVTLIADFDDADGLAEYATHPEHVAAAAIVKSHAVGRAASDFTL